MSHNWCVCVACFCALLTHPVVCTQTFYKLVGSADSTAAADKYVPFLMEAFFTCGPNEYCAKVVKIKGSSGYTEEIDQKAVEEDATVYKKVKTPITDGSSWSEWHPIMCSATCGGGKRTLVRYCYSSMPCKGGGLRLEEKCNTEICPDLLNCTYHTTVFPYGSVLLRHNPSCEISDSDAIMTGIKLEKDGDDIRCNVSCCDFEGPICDMIVKYESTIDCGGFGFISSFPLRKELNTNMYSYKCCELFLSKWRERMRCIENATPFIDNHVKVIDSLTKIPIQCPPGFGLSMLTLNRDAAEMKLQVIFRCCQLAY